MENGLDEVETPGRDLRRETMITTTIDGIELQLISDPKLFSPLSIDRGTLAMLSVVSFSAEDKVLDLGCGIGVVGIVAAKKGATVVMSDVDPLAIEITQENLVLNKVSGVTVVCSDGFHQITEAGFTLIASNPPYHTDFSVAKHFIEKGFNRLVIGGRLVMVTKRVEWYKQKLTAIFGGVTLHSIDGYTVFVAEKRRPHYANKSNR